MKRWLLIGATVCSPPVVLVALALVLASHSLAACSATALPGAEASAKAREEIPRWLMPFYIGAATQYHLGTDGWAWLASINAQETTFGTNLSRSTAGAEGWMQFMPETWARYQVDADHDGVANPYAAEDAIYTAANYLHASGAPSNWSAAVYSYNHASWYVAQVATRAESYLAEPRAIAVGYEGGGTGAPGPTESTPTAEGTGAHGNKLTLTGTSTTWTGGGSEPAIEMRDSSTVGGTWLVTYPNGHSIRVAQTAVGPPGSGAHVPLLASNAAALRAAGYTGRFPTGAKISATYESGVSSGSEGAASCGETESLEGGGAERIEAAAEKLAAMHVPYNYGGGHVQPARPTAGQEGNYLGMDCSASVSWVLQHAGIKVETMVSGNFEVWGKPGAGHYITIYANPSHVWMAISSPRHPQVRYFGTGAWGAPPSETGPTWFRTPPTEAFKNEFVARHPAGL